MAEELRCALLCQHDAQVQDPDPLWRVIAPEWPVHRGKRSTSVHHFAGQGDTS